MSKIYTAYQYEDDFKPKRLSNWEVPKQPFGDRPKVKRRPTRIIANDRGHLLSDVPRPSGNPFAGLYIGTYQLPKKITREVAEELSRPRKHYLSEKRSRYSKSAPSRKGTSPSAVSPTPGTPLLKQLEAIDQRKESQLVCQGERLNEFQTGNIEDKQQVRSNVLEELKKPKEFMPPCLKEENRSKPEGINQYQPYNKTDELDYSRPVSYDTNIKLADIPSQAIENCSNHHQLCRLPATGSPSAARPVENYTQDTEQAVKYPEIVNREPAIASPPQPTSPKTCKVPPLMSAQTNSQFARTLKLENQKHHPLPDIIEDALYRSFQFDKNKNPGIALNTEPKAAAIGCKCYGVPGPTQCSKLRVYRPKTAGNAQTKRDSIPKDDRPRTSSDRGTREKDNFTEMELALCWDYHPKNADLEPKRPTHIDGSNGSAAPSVFTLVHPIHNEHKSGCPTPDKPASFKSLSPKCEDDLKSKPRTAWDEDDVSNKYLQRQLMKIQERSNPSAVMNVIDNYNGLATKENSSPNIPREKAKSSSAGSRSSSKKNSHCSKEHSELINKNNLTLGSSDLGSIHLKNQKHYCSSPNLATIDHELNRSEKKPRGGQECKNGNCGSVSSGSSNDKNNNIKNGHSNSKHHSKLLNARPCMACSSKPSSGSNNHCKPPEYKMAFKAGKPNGMNGGGAAALNKLNNEHKLHIPKPKTPFAKRSYSIGTLVPPFSLWPGTTGQDYPEHWRLASVYQHSYKPVQTRRKPFLRSVYQ